MVRRQCRLTHTPHAVTQFITACRLPSVPWTIIILFIILLVVVRSASVSCTAGILTYYITLRTVVYTIWCNAHDDDALAKADGSQTTCWLRHPRAVVHPSLSPSSYSSRNQHRHLTTPLPPNVANRHRRSARRATDNFKAALSPTPICVTASM